MIAIRDIIDYLHTIAPNHLQESYDNAGLIVGDASTECMGVITCLDSTEEVIDEAISKGCNLVVAHHPIIFKGLKRLTGANYIERTIIKAIQNNIAIFAIHTNLDNVLKDGVNGRIADRLALSNQTVLLDKIPEKNIGSGVFGTLKTPMPEMEFLQYLKDVMQVNTVKYTSLLNKPIQNVAICGGSGQFLLQTAIAREADVFISADIKYHEYFDADGRVLIADIGHFESEQFTIDLLQEIITKKFRTFAVLRTEVCTNPVKYL